MSLKTRRILFILFILAFVIATPLLLLYSAGYRLDLQNRQIFKTGNLLLEGKELKDVSVFINQEEYKENLRKKLYITNLKAGKYYIDLKKDGYLDWHKEVEIESNITTFVKNIFLFKKPNTEIVTEAAAQTFSTSPDKNQIAILEKNNSGLFEIFTYSLKNNEKKLIYRSSAPENQIKLIGWAPSSKKLLINNNGKYLVLNTEKSQDTISLDFLNENFQHVFWHLESDNLLLASNNHQLFQVNLALKQSELLYNEILVENTLLPEFKIDNNFIFFFKKENGKTNLYRIDRSVNLNEKVSEIPKANNYSFIQSPPNIITFINSEQSNLIIVRPQTTISSDLENYSVKQFNAKNAFWSNQKIEELKPNYYLTYFNDHEIFKYDLNEDKDELINRYGGTLDNTLVFNEDYYIYLIDNQIKILEVPLNDKSRNQYDYLKNMGEIQDIFYQDNLLYVITKENSQYKLYTQELY